MGVIYRCLMRKRINESEELMRLRRKYTSRFAIEEFQLKRFNEIWKRAFTNVPFYREWKDTYGLPAQISNLSETVAWPVLTKADLRDLTRFVRLDVAMPSGRLMTGGSTGEPVRLPSWGDTRSAISQIVGRRAYGIEPGDRTFLLWGHEHLYGKGLKRRINVLKRCLKDWLSDWIRVSAYDLGKAAMVNAYKVFARFRPKFFIGFSPAVLAFVRQNNDRKGLVDTVKVILCTAGPLSLDEKKEIEDFFGGRVCMEYGSVECGAMAYTRPSDGFYNVFWDTHLLQAQKQADGECKNLVTRLMDCYVPLIRYDIGDYLELDPRNEADDAKSVLEIKSVKGRPSEIVAFACGVSFFGALVGDCVKQVPEVIASQIAVDENANRLELRVIANVTLPEEKLGLIKNRLELTVADMDKVDVKVVQMDKLFMTVGGKIPRVVRL